MILSDSQIEVNNELQAEAIKTGEWPPRATRMRVHNLIWLLQRLPQDLEVMQFNGSERVWHKAQIPTVEKVAIDEPYEDVHCVRDNEEGFDVVIL